MDTTKLDSELTICLMTSAHRARQRRHHLHPGACVLSHTAPKARPKLWAAPAELWDHPQKPWGQQDMALARHHISLQRCPCLQSHELKEDGVHKQHGSSAHASKRN